MRKIRVYVWDGPELFATIEWEFKNEDRIPVEAMDCIAYHVMEGRRVEVALLRRS